MRRDACPAARARTFARSARNVVAHGHALTADMASCERSPADAHRLLTTDHAATDAPPTPWKGLGSREATTPYLGCR
jgi:hypothetical protein